jgi:anti-anti-sigma factor
MRSSDPYRLQKPFGLTLRSTGSTAYVRLEGEFDLSSRKEFEACLVAVHDSGPAEVIIDLREVVFIDSTALQLVIDAWDRTRKHQMDFALFMGESNSVRGVFRETGLDRTLPIVPAFEVPASAQTQALSA